jgi:DNA-binding CsgD family transcriptional regulator
VGRPSERAASSIIRACYAAEGDLASLRTRFFDRLRRVVTIDAAFFAVADPDTLLFTFARADEALVPAGPIFLAQEFGDGEDVNRFARLAEARRPVATLDEATKGERKSSARYREAIAPLGFGDELRVALRVGSVTWGFLCLHREGATGYSPSEMAILEEIAPHAGEAIRRIVARSMAEAGEAGGEPGVVLVADDHVIGLTNAAEMWLEELDLQLEIGDPIALPFRVVLQQLTMLERGGASPTPASIRLMTRRGSVLEAHAARLRANRDRHSFAITLAPARSRARAGIHLAAHHLTPAQRRVAELVLRGRSTKQIVSDLRIGEHTVQDHLKTVFEKLGVGSRRELVSALLR